MVFWLVFLTNVVIVQDLFPLVQQYILLLFVSSAIFCVYYCYPCCYLCCVVMVAPEINIIIWLFWFSSSHHLKIFNYFSRVNRKATKRCDFVILCAVVLHKKNKLFVLNLRNTSSVSVVKVKHITQIIINLVQSCFFVDSFYYFIFVNTKLSNKTKKENRINNNIHITIPIPIPQATTHHHVIDHNFFLWFVEQQ
jgi:hypothetical protein